MSQKVAIILIHVIQDYQLAFLIMLVQRLIYFYNIFYVVPNIVLKLTVVNDVFVI